MVLGIVGVIFGMVVFLLDFVFWGGVTFLNRVVDDLVGAMQEIVEDKVVVNVDHQLLEEGMKEPGRSRIIWRLICCKMLLKTKTMMTK